MGIESIWVGRILIEKFRLAYDICTKERRFDDERYFDLQERRYILL